MAPSKPHTNNKIALLCTLHTSSPQAKSTVLSLLNSARTDYYSRPASLCTTWSYFTPSKRARAPSQLIAPAEHETLVGGVEIYSDKSALSSQMGESWFKTFEERVQQEGLYDEAKGRKGEDMVVWYPTVGFVSRSDDAEVGAAPFGAGVVVMLAVFTCKDGGREKVVEVIGKYTEWVKENEPGVLTYCTMTRPKGPNQVLLFERYKDHKALAAHGSTKEFKTMFKGIAPHIEVKQTKLQEFMELDTSFTGNIPGGPQKTLAKL